jgi:diguanylate cyclase (GGDEF)-like protein
MNLIDPRTVILLAGVMSGLMSMVLFALKRNYPASVKGLREWAIALLVLFAGGLLVGLRDILPPLISISFSSFLLWSGLYLAYCGTHRFFDATPRTTPWMLVIMGVLAVQVWFTVIEPSYHMRLVLTTLLTACLCGAHAWLMLKQGAITFARGLAIGVLVALTSIQLMRLGTSFPLPLGADFFNTSAQQMIYITGFAFSIFLFSISMVLMATDRLRQEFEYLAIHDSLTNAFTRRYTNKLCQRELERCVRHGRAMSLLWMDIDHFKSINDTRGHQAGDQVLTDFVANVNVLLRSSDVLGRFGGEEFVVLLPETSLAVATVVAERIRATMADQSGPTVSIGITTNRTGGDTVDALLARADAAMYRAKANGRNRVEVS